jgi:hypothetical protein
MAKKRLLKSVEDKISEETKALRKKVTKGTREGAGLVRIKIRVKRGTRGKA